MAQEQRFLGEILARRGVVQRVDGGFVCVSVVDQGPGVDEATAERLFEPFYSTKGDLGNGLGLYITKEIIEIVSGASYGA